MSPDHPCELQFSRKLMIAHSLLWGVSSLAAVQCTHNLQVPQIAAGQYPEMLSASLGAARSGCRFGLCPAGCCG